MATENVDELLACCGCLAILCLFPPRLNMTQKRRLSKDIESIPDI